MVSRKHPNDPRLHLGIWVWALTTRAKTRASGSDRNRRYSSGQSRLCVIVTDSSFKAGILLSMKIIQLYFNLKVYKSRLLSDKEAGNYLKPFFPPLQKLHP